LEAFSEGLAGILGQEYGDALQDFSAPIFLPASARVLVLPSVVESQTMNPETTIAELLRLWPRLPELAGAGWPAMYWQLLDLLRAFRRAAADQQRARIAIGVQRLLASLPEVRAAWAVEAAVLMRGGDVVTRSGALAAPATEDDVWAAVDDLLQPRTVTRWTDVLAPGRVQSGQRFAVIVGLTCQDGAGDCVTASPSSYGTLPVTGTSLRPHRASRHCTWNTVRGSRRTISLGRHRRI
jgi:hypothetical protein